jgi:hypothetical protein
MFRSPASPSGTFAIALRCEVKTILPPEFGEKLHFGEKTHDAARKPTASTILPPCMLTRILSPTLGCFMGERACQPGDCSCVKSLKSSASEAFLVLVQGQTVAHRNFLSRRVLYLSGVHLPPCVQPRPSRV